MNQPHSSRRRFIKASAVALSSALAAPAIVRPAHAASRKLSFYHTHTDEKLALEIQDIEQRAPDALAEVNHFLRDFRTGEVHDIDPNLMQLLCALKEKTGSDKHFEVISGYRSPKTNEKLRKNSSGVAKKSLHMQGKAIDIRLTGFDTRKLQKLSKSLARGGVGYYSKSNFIHVDTGRVRYW